MIFSLSLFGVDIWTLYLGAPQEDDPHTIYPGQELTL